MNNKKYGNYKCGELLGVGGYGSVYFAEKNGEKFAIKALDKDKIIEENLVENIKKEIQLMRMISHPYIVKLYEVIATQQKIMLVMEFIEGGDLFDTIKTEEDSKISEERSRIYFQQMIQALEYCHKLNIIHRDLKPENILLDKKNDCIKISDFGLSTILKSKDELIKNACGTTNYLAPEVVKLTGYQGQPSDIWSAGCILYNCVTGSFPFHDEESSKLLQNILSGNVSYPKYLSKQLVDLLRRIFDVNPKTRITIPQIKEHSWFKIGFKLVKGVIDQSKSHIYESNNIKYVEEEVIKEGHLVKGDLYKEVDYSKVSILNGFELLTMMSGKWVTEMFYQSDKSEIGKEVKEKENFILFFKLEGKEVIKKIEEYLKKECNCNRVLFISNSNFQFEINISISKEKESEKMKKSQTNFKFEIYLYYVSQYKTCLILRYLFGRKDLYSELCERFISQLDKNNYVLLDR